MIFMTPHIDEKFFKKIGSTDYLGKNDRLFTILKQAFIDGVEKSVDDGADLVTKDVEKVVPLKLYFESPEVSSPEVKLRSITPSVRENIKNVFNRKPEELAKYLGIDTPKASALMFSDLNSFYCAFTSKEVFSINGLLEILDDSE